MLTYVIWLVLGDIGIWTTLWRWSASVLNCIEATKTKSSEFIEELKDLRGWRTWTLKKNPPKMFLWPSAEEKMQLLMVSCLLWVRWLSVRKATSVYNLREYLCWYRTFPLYGLLPKAGRTWQQKCVCEEFIWQSEQKVRLQGLCECYPKARWYAHLKFEWRRKLALLRANAWNHLEEFMECFNNKFFVEMVCTGLEEISDLMMT